MDRYFSASKRHCPSWGATTPGAVGLEGHDLMEEKYNNTSGENCDIMDISWEEYADRSWSLLRSHQWFISWTNPMKMHDLEVYTPPLILGNLHIQTTTPKVVEPPWKIGGAPSPTWPTGELIGACFNGVPKEQILISARFIEMESQISWTALFYPPIADEVYSLKTTEHVI